MSSGLTEFLDWIGPVQEDTTVTCSGRRWNNTSPVGEINKTTVGIVLPAVGLVGIGVESNGIMVQFNYSAPQPFSLLDWNSVVNQSILQQQGLFLAIRYRVGNVATRYRLCGNLPIVFGPPITFSGGGRNQIPAPLYNGQIIQPQFVLECWGSIFPTTDYALNVPITLQTSILNEPSPFIGGGLQLAPTINGQQTSNLFVNLPAAVPIVFDPSGPWNSN